MNSWPQSSQKLTWRFLLKTTLAEAQIGQAAFEFMRGRSLQQGRADLSRRKFGFCGFQTGWLAMNLNTAAHTGKMRSLEEPGFRAGSAAIS
jgi:hypothetical protein